MQESKQLLKLFPEGRGKTARQFASGFHGQGGEGSVAFAAEVFEREHEHEPVGKREAGDGRESVFRDAEARLAVEGEAKARFGQRGLVLVVLTAADAEFFLQRFLRLLRVASDFLGDAEQSNETIGACGR